MRLQRDKMTFGEIADRWASELEEAKMPGRLDSCAIVRRLYADVMLGRFDDLEVSPSI